MNTTFPSTELRNKLPKLVDEASKTFAGFTITRGGVRKSIDRTGHRSWEEFNSGGE